MSLLVARWSLAWRGGPLCAESEGDGWHVSCWGRTMTQRKTSVSLLLVSMLLATALGCDPPGEAAHAVLAAQPERAPAQPASVQVAKEGTHFDPPVAASDIPEGAWMCDMGSVHYAALDHGTGECPRCGMKLTKKGGSQAK